MSRFLLLLYMMLSVSASAGEIGFRYNNGMADTASLVEFSPNTAGKLLEIKYDWLPLGENLYLEGAAGKFAPYDFDTMSPHTVAELSPGIQVKAGAIEVKLSQGISNLCGIEFPTHVALELTDEHSGFSIGFERSHYSNAHTGEIGFDFTGLTIGLKI